MSGRLSSAMVYTLDDSTLHSIRLMIEEGYGTFLNNERRCVSCVSTHFLDGEGFRFTSVSLPFAACRNKTFGQRLQMSFLF